MRKSLQTFYKCRCCHKKKEEEGGGSYVKPAIVKYFTALSNMTAVLVASLQVRTQTERETEREVETEVDFKD